ncbi:Uma2 family endonuclease [Clostridium sp.]|uniref:Uma2 family endonuclease n=1 Tax=Clostridium sp. TaxID=1506 RepID=UPI002618E90F|nr:Uma2 family endonuclease [Clostridium sp.]
MFLTCKEAITMGQSCISPLKIIFEVVSKSTASHDHITKLSVYQKYGVLEYNIVEQNGHIVQYGL